MRVVKILGLKILEWGSTISSADTNKVKKVLPVSLPSTGGRKSFPSYYIDGENSSLTLGGLLKVLSPDFSFNSIPVIRKLVKSHPILSQALNNIVELANTGYDIKFDSSVKGNMAVAMKKHITQKAKTWADTEADIHGLINKKIAQVMISGALSSEWVPNINLDGIESNFLVNPEHIRFVYNDTTRRHDVYQQVGLSEVPKVNTQGLIKLNPLTYKYFSLNGDTDLPYGYPPFLAALDSIHLERTMLDNIKFIVDQLGVMGFLHVLYQKPIFSGIPINTTNYTKALENFLDEAADKLKTGMKDGIVVGYQDDVEFDFKQVTKDITGVKELWDLNESNLTSGVKTDPSLLGKNHGSTETQITVVFTKMLSQLKNVQNLVKADLEFGFTLELKLAGYKFDSLEIVFNPSTGIYKLKDEQSEEIRIRNSNALYYDGIINLDEYARRHGLEKADQVNPRVMRVQIAATSDEDVQQKAKRKDQKTKAKRDATQKKQPTPKTLK